MKTSTAMALVLFVFFSSSAFAQQAYKPTKIHAQFRCTLEDDTQFSFNMTPQKEKVWLSASGSNMGLKLKLSHVLYAKCPGCYQVKGTLDGADFSFSIRGRFPHGADRAAISVTTKNANGVAETQVLTAKCQREE